jgi:hypothetical protein
LGTQSPHRFELGDFIGPIEPYYITDGPPILGISSIEIAAS